MRCAVFSFSFLLALFGVWHTFFVSFLPPPLHPSVSAGSWILLLSLSHRAFSLGWREFLVLSVYGTHQSAAIQTAILVTASPSGTAYAADDLADLFLSMAGRSCLLEFQCTHQTRGASPDLTSPPKRKWDRTVSQINVFTMAADSNMYCNENAIHLRVYSSY